MVAVERIQELFEALGPASDDVTSIARMGDRTWAIAFADEEIVTIDFVEEQNKLVLGIDLGAAAENRRLAVYTAMLGFNYLWRETGGVKTALGGEDLVLLFELNAVGLTLEELRNVLGNFMEKARVFRRFVVSEGGTDETTEGAFAAGMRV